MSDWSGKHRPVLELIARLAGRSAGVQLGAGTADGIPDSDIAAAVASARQMRPHHKRVDKEGKPKLFAIPTCVRPELLHLRYACLVELIPFVSRICASKIADDRLPSRVARYAAYIAAQVIAGRKVGPDQIEQAAWAIDVDASALAKQVGYAVAWCEGELHEAERAFVQAMRKWVPALCQDGFPPERRVVEAMAKARNRAA